MPPCSEFPAYAGPNGATRHGVALDIGIVLVGQVEEGTLQLEQAGEKVFTFVESNDNPTPIELSSAMGKL